MMSNKELIKRIDAYIDCENVSDRESETQLLEACRGALSHKYVPMTDEDARKLFAMNLHNLSPEVMIQTIEEIVIRRAGLEIQND